MKQRPASAGRREFLKAGVVLTGAGALLTAVRATQASASLLEAPRATVVLHDPRLPIDAGLFAGLDAAGAYFIPLAGDPVRQWRGAQRDVLAHPATRLLGVTRWPDFLIVRGLAAETRRRVRHESLDPTTGVMTWLIA